MTGNSRLWTSPSAVWLVAVTCCFAAQPKPETPAYLDPVSAGPDYAIQGEFVGELTPGRYGAQVVALGEGRFSVVGYEGGLPGDGWKRGDVLYRAEAMMSEGTVKFQTKGWTAVLRDGLLTVFDEKGDKLGEMKKVLRTSPTLGANPPAGAEVLFDGSSVDAFLGGQFALGDLLAANCVSRETFGDHQAHLEFRTPFKPLARGQARGNSGAYIQSRYEVQVLDSFGLEGEDNECGGIYRQSRPVVNMCFPPLTWQTYDYDFTAARYDADGNKTANARVTVRHNGVVIHDNLELTRETPGKAKEGPEPLGLYLQGHGNPVVYRNVWIVRK